MKFYFLASLMFLFGCMKNPENTQDFGAEVPTEAMQAAINQIPPPDPLQIQKGQYASSETTTTIESLAPAITSQRLDTVVDRTEDANQVQLVVRTRIGERVAGQSQMQISVNESHPTVSKHGDTTASVRAVDLVSPLSIMKSMDERLTEMDETAKPDHITYHNLKVEQTFIPLPASVIAQSDCGGLAPESCTKDLSAYHIQFDQVRWRNNLGDRTGYSFYFSNDVPYFAHLMELCQEAHISYHTQRIHVFQCEQIRDFRFR